MEKSSVKLNIGPWIIVGGIILTSSVWSMSVIAHTHIIRYMTWAGVTLLLLFMLIVRGELDFQILKQKIFVIFGFYILIASLSLLKAINFGEWFFDMSRLTLMAVYLYAATMYLKSADDIAKPFVLTVIGLGVYGLWLTKFGNYLPRYIANMGTRHLFSQFLLLLLPFCLSVKGKWRKWGILAASLVVLNILMTNSRAAIVALSISASITAAIFNRKAMCLILLAVLVIGSIFVINNRLYQRIANSKSAYYRFAVWKQTLRMTWDEFMVGAGNWRLAILPYSPGFLEENIGDSYYYLEAHNQYLEVLSEKSIFGLIAYVGLFFSVLWYAFKSGNVYVFMGITSYMFYVMFDNKQRAPHLMILMTLFALAITGYHQVKKVKLRWPLFIASGAVFLILVAYLSRFDMEKRFYRSQIARTKLNDPDTALRHLSYIPIFASIERHTMPYCWFRGDAYKAKGQLAEAVVEFGKAFKQNPNNIFVLMSLGEALFYSGFHDQSKEMYERVLEIVPGHKIATMNLILIEKGENYETVENSFINGSDSPTCCSACPAVGEGFRATSVKGCKESHKAIRGNGKGAKVDY